MDISELISKVEATLDGGVSRTFARIENNSLLTFEKRFQEQQKLFRRVDQIGRLAGFASGARSAVDAAIASQSALDRQLSLAREIGAFSASQLAFEDASRWQTNATEVACRSAITDWSAAHRALHANALVGSLTTATYLAEKNSAFQAMMTPLAHAVPPFAGGTLAGWEERLFDRMKLIERPWMLPNDPASSMLGFARLTRLSDALRSSTPYASELSAFLQEELGEVVALDGEATPEERDEAAIEAGMRPELIAFPREEYRVVVGASGLVLNLPPLPIPQPVEGSNPGAAFDPTVAQILCQVETRLRLLVVEGLTRQTGENWAKHRVPPEVRSRWRQRQEEERAKGRAVYSEIFYADLMDLEAVICRGDNWRDVFRDVFSNKQHLSLSLQHLAPIRNDGAHHRPIGMAQRLRLVTEAASILKALGVNIFH